VLADRIAIIDHGRIVAQGTPAALKSEIGRSTVEAVPIEPEQRARVAEVLRHFGEPVSSSRGAAVRLASADTGLADVVRALDADGVRVENLQLHQPSLDDVFLAKTGRSLEGSGEDADGVAPGLAMDAATA